MNNLISNAIVGNVICSDCHGRKDLSQNTDIWKMCNCTQPAINTAGLSLSI